MFSRASQNLVHIPLARVPRRVALLSRIENSFSIATSFSMRRDIFVSRAIAGESFPASQKTFT
jgi:hypothetical protein